MTPYLATLILGLRSLTTIHKLWLRLFHIADMSIYIPWNSFVIFQCLHFPNLSSALPVSDPTPTSRSELLSSWEMLEVWRLKKGLLFEPDCRWLTRNKRLMLFVICSMNLLDEDHLCKCEQNHMLCSLLRGPFLSTWVYGLYISNIVTSSSPLGLSVLKSLSFLKPFFSKTFWLAPCVELIHATIFLICWWWLSGIYQSFCIIKL